MKRKVYIAGAYGAPTIFGRARNIYRAWRMAKRVWRDGHYAFCPHANSAFMDKCCPREQFLQGDIEFLYDCDVLLLLDGWEKSEGAKEERHIAIRHGKIILFEHEWTWFVTRWG